MFPAKKVMSSDVVSVSRDTDIYEAIATMVNANVTGLPVVNPDGTLAGILSEKDVLRLLCDAEDHAGKVEGYMTDEIVTFGEDDSLIDISDCLMKHNFRRVPILRDGKIVGIVSRRDVVRFILSLRHKK